jgi:hypothetical protein
MSAKDYMENNRKARLDYESRKREAVDKLLDFFIDTRGCSRLIAGGYAMEAVRARYDEISEGLKE